MIINIYCIYSYAYCIISILMIAFLLLHIYVFSCLYVGPKHEDPLAQADVIDAIINGTYGKIDGVSISVSDVSVITPAIGRAVEAGIPVITFDSDAQESKREAYIGTDNYAFGIELGKLLDQLAPTGGTYGILAASAPNVVQRVEGVRERLADTKWVEVSVWGGIYVDVAVCFASFNSPPTKYS